MYQPKMDSTEAWLYGWETDQYDKNLFDLIPIQRYKLQKY